MAFGAFLIIGVLVGGGIQIVVGGLLGAVILRAACSLFNKISGGSPNSADDIEKPQMVDGASEFNFQAVANQSESPYTAPQTLEVASLGPTRRGVPAPSFGNAFVVCLLTSVSNFLMSFVSALVSMFIGIGGMLVGQAVLLILGLLVFAMIISWRLPTSFGKAIAVAVISLVILILVVISIVTVVVGLLSILG